jgi:hypothetical protein
MTRLQRTYAASPDFREFPATLLITLCWSANFDSDTQTYARAAAEEEPASRADWIRFPSRGHARVSRGTENLSEIDVRREFRDLHGSAQFVAGHEPGYRVLRLERVMVISARHEGRLPHMRLSSASRACEHCMDRGMRDHIEPCRR